MATSTSPAQGRKSFLSLRFGGVTLSALAYFIGFAMLLPTLPRYVENELNGSDLAIGIVAGIFGVSAGIVRPFLGRAGDIYGRRILLMGGAALSGLSILGYPIWPSIPVLVGLRMVTGIGESAAFVGAAVSTQDMAPDDRRGEAASYFSLAIYLGLGVGPFLGETIDNRFGFTGVIYASSAMLFFSALLGASVPNFAKPSNRPARRPGFLHPAAVKPGILLTLSLLGFVGYTTFLAVYLDRLGGGPDTGSAGPVFILYSAIVLVFRLFLANLPDRLGPRVSGAAAFGLITLGLGIVAAWGTITGVYVGTAVLACGAAFNFPALLLLVLADTDAEERGFAVASFGFFFDAAGALGAPILGLAIQLFASERAAFAVGALAAGAGLVGLLRLTATPLPRQTPG